MDRRSKPLSSEERGVIFAVHQRGNNPSRQRDLPGVGALAEGRLWLLPAGGAAHL